MKTTTITNGVAAALFATLLLPQVATAAEESQVIEEIIVIAQKREQSMTDVPMSVEAASGEQLSDLGITDAADLFKAAAGFSSNALPFSETCSLDKKTIFAYSFFSKFAAGYRCVA